MKTLHKRLVFAFATIVCPCLPTGTDAATIMYVPDQGFALSADGESGLVDIGGLNKPLNFTAIQSLSGGMGWRWEPTVDWFHEFVPERGPGIGSSAMRLETGMAIDEELDWTTDSRAVANLANTGEREPGFFFDSEGFLAIRFYEEQFGWENEEALPYYGWIRVSHSAEDMALTVHDWAWNSAAGESILAGQIPEPAAYAVVFGVAVLLFVLARTRF